MPEAKKTPETPKQEPTQLNLFWNRTRQRKPAGV